MSALVMTRQRERELHNKDLPRILDDDLTAVKMRNYVDCTLNSN